MAEELEVVLGDDFGCRFEKMVGSCCSWCRFLQRVDADFEQVGANFTGFGAKVAGFGADFSDSSKTNFRW